MSAKVHINVTPLASGKYVGRVNISFELDAGRQACYSYATRPERSEPAARLQAEALVHDAIAHFDRLGWARAA
ncbi:hypothetical protein [Bordetella genomosp. 5]|uniref:hypothetical protein n=1 Tax=Bordetella genomosp. 5 TaxID=1395608 RepID=UPI00113FCC5F|nr:hypothetical protein [Bordetella genomosp. 5]